MEALKEIRGFQLQATQINIPPTLLHGVLCVSCAVKWIFYYEEDKSCTRSRRNSTSNGKLITEIPVRQNNGEDENSVYRFRRGTMLSNEDWNSYPRIYRSWHATQHPFGDGSRLILSPARRAVFDIPVSRLSVL